MMFVPENKNQASVMAAIAKSLRVDEVQLDTPLRKSPVKPLSEKEMIDIEREFEGLNVISVYRGQRPKVKPLDNSEELRRRGKFVE